MSARRSLCSGDHTCLFLPPFRRKRGVRDVRAANRQGMVWRRGGGRRGSRWWRGTGVVPVHLGHAASELLWADFLLHRHRRARGGGSLASPPWPTQGRLSGKPHSSDPHGHPGDTVGLPRCGLGPSSLSQSRGGIGEEWAGEDGERSGEEGAAQTNWDYHDPALSPKSGPGHSGERRRNPKRGDAEQSGCPASLSVPIFPASEPLTDTSGWETGGMCEEIDLFHRERCPNTKTTYWPSDSSQQIKSHLAICSRGTQISRRLQSSVDDLQLCTSLRHQHEPFLLLTTWMNLLAELSSILAVGCHLLKFEIIGCVLVGLSFILCAHMAVCSLHCYCEVYTFEHIW